MPAITYFFGIGLHNKHTKRLFARFQWNAQPIERIRTDGYHFSLFKEFLIPFPGNELGFSCANDKLGESFAEVSGFGAFIFFINGVRKTELLLFFVVKSDEQV